MTKAQAATADVFLTALKALPKAERDAVLVRIARDKALARDILDLALIGKRRAEVSRTFREYVAERSGRGATPARFGRGARRPATNGAN